MKISWSCDSCKMANKVDIKPGSDVPTMAARVKGSHKETSRGHCPNNHAEVSGQMSFLGAGIPHFKILNPEPEKPKKGEGPFIDLFVGVTRKQ